MGVFSMMWLQSYKELHCFCISEYFLDDRNILMSCLRAKPKSISLAFLWLLVSVTSTLSKAYVVRAASRVSFLMNFAHSNLNSSSNPSTRNEIIVLSD